MSNVENKTVRGVIERIGYASGKFLIVLENSDDVHVISVPVLTSAEGVMNISAGSFSNTVYWGQDNKSYTDNLSKLPLTLALSKVNDRIEIVWEKNLGLLENHDWHIKEFKNLTFLNRGEYTALC